MITEAQKNVLICAIDGLAENAQEDCAMHPEDHNVEHKDDFTEEMAQAEAHDTMILVFREDGVQGAMDNGYVFDEGDDDEPTGLADCSVNDIVAFIKEHRAETQKAV